jgi:hypothetical protein
MATCSTARQHNTSCRNTQVNLIQPGLLLQRGSPDVADFVAKVGAELPKNKNGK